MTYPDGRMVELEVYGDIPYLREWGSHPSFPATPAPAARVSLSSCERGATPLAGCSDDDEGRDGDVDMPAPSTLQGMLAERRRDGLSLYRV